jgi:hypothetical protein
MSKDIFISYSRRDQEFVTRLASDLDQHVTGVWFDQSAIRAGQRWHDEILEGVRDCKAFILVLSPDAMQSRYVREELDTALELGKPIFPVIYRSARWTEEFAPLVKDIQSIDLQSGSYTDNFHKLVDGLVEAGAIASSSERPFLREPTRIGVQVVFKKALSWALAWSLGWLIFLILTFIFLFIFVIIQNRAGQEDILNFLTFSFSGWTGGFIGGLIAGILTMFTLRPYATSIFWKHISPTIRIWAVSGPVGMTLSGIITVISIIIGVINIQDRMPACQRSELIPCLSRILSNPSAQDAGVVILILTLFIFFVTIIWFLTGTLSGWFIVRHIRRLEPGITRPQGLGVSISWGCGAIVAALATMLTIAILTAIFKL